MPPEPVVMTEWEVPEPMSSGTATRGLTKEVLEAMQKQPWLTV